MTDTLGFLKELRRVSWRGVENNEQPSDDLPQHAWEHVHVAMLEKKFGYGNTLVVKGAYKANIDLEMVACGKKFFPVNGVVDLSSVFFLTKHLFILPVGCTVIVENGMRLSVGGEPMALLISGLVDIKIRGLTTGFFPCANADQTHLVKRVCDSLVYVVRDIEDILSAASDAPTSYAMLPNRVSKEAIIWWDKCLHPYTDYLFCSPGRGATLQRAYAPKTVAAYVACGSKLQPELVVGTVADKSFDTIIAIGVESERLPVKQVTLPKAPERAVKPDLGPWLTQQLGVPGVRAKSVLRVQVDPNRHIDCAKDQSGHTLDEPMLSVLSQGDSVKLESKVITMDKPTIMVVHGRISATIERHAGGALWFVPLRLFSHTAWYRKWIKCRKKIFDLRSQIIWTDIKQHWRARDTDVRYRVADVDVVEIVEQYYTVACDLYRSMEPALKEAFESFG